jgi:Uma2 family endonuclease
MTAYMLNLESVIELSIELSDEQFYQLCRRNSDLRFERSATGNKNSELNADLVFWNRRTKLGYVFGSNSGFKLPNGANRSPDLSWICKNRWEALSKAERTRFAPICPDFVVELMSTSDRLGVLQAKLVEYIENGAKLGWLINPEARQVEIYRPGEEMELLESPETLLGENVLPGFELDLAFMWA